jgi:DNA-directed RNA polymerase subunit RPC12/RpoP
MISEFVKELRNEAQEVRLCSNECESAELLDRAADTIEMLSEKAREPKHGEWIERYGSSMGIYQCSECGNLIHSPYEDIRKKFHAWCGRCGADMRGADDE